MAEEFATGVGGRGRSGDNMRIAAISALWNVSSAPLSALDLMPLNSFRPRFARVNNPVIHQNAASMIPSLTAFRMSFRVLSKGIF